MDPIVKLQGLAALQVTERKQGEIMAQALATTSAQETVRPAPTGGASLTELDEDSSKFDGASIGLARTLKPIGIFAAAITTVSSLATGAEAQTVLANTLNNLTPTTKGVIASSTNLDSSQYSIDYQPFQLTPGDAISSVTFVGGHFLRTANGVIDTGVSPDGYTLQIFSSKAQIDANPLLGDLGTINGAVITPFETVNGHTLYTFTFTAATAITVPGPEVYLGAYSISTPSVSGTLALVSTGDVTALPGYGRASGFNSGVTTAPVGAEIIGFQPAPVPEFGTEVGTGAGFALLGALGAFGYVKRFINNHQE